MNIPSFDLNDFTDGGASKKTFVDGIGKAYGEIGFIALSNHGLTDEIQKGLYRSIQDFFALSDNVKLTYSDQELKGQRGYTPKNKEHAKDSKHADLKEFYHTGQIANESPFPKNIFPAEIQDFEKHQVEAFKVLENTGAIILRALALFLSLDENYFDDKVIGGNSILRSIHYYPLTEEQVKGESVRAGEHGDINLITLLMGASAEGLEIKNNNDEWVAVTALPGQIVVNVGDMLERLTNNRLKSTIHRVVNPKGSKSGTSRYSIPFFLHPKPAMDLSCLPSCVSETTPKAYTDISAGEFLIQRLKEIGLA